MCEHYHHPSIDDCQYGQEVVLAVRKQDRTKIDILIHVVLERNSVDSAECMSDQCFCVKAHFTTKFA